MNESEQRLPDGVRIITPRHVLRERVGYGGIDPAAMEKANEAVAVSVAETDYMPMALDFLTRIQKSIEFVRSSKQRDKAIIEKITSPIMDLKASSGMLGYPLISEIADVILDFLEGLDGMNEDALEIAVVHHKTLSTIVQTGLRGDGGDEGYALSRELYNVCQRYHKKYNTGKDKENSKD